jgi:hypothetical protein
MKNWQAISHAMNLDIPDEQLVRLTPSLDGLEAAFTPLRSGIPAGADPAAIFRTAVEDAE